MKEKIIRTLVSKKPPGRYHHCPMLPRFAAGSNLLMSSRALAAFSCCFFSNFSLRSAQNAFKDSLLSGAWLAICALLLRTDSIGILLTVGKVGVCLLFDSSATTTVGMLACIKSVWGTFFYIKFCVAGSPSSSSFIILPFRKRSARILCTSD